MITNHLPRLLIEIDSLRGRLEMLIEAVKNVEKDYNYFIYCVIIEREIPRANIFIYIYLI